MWPVSGVGGNAGVPVIKHCCHLTEMPSGILPHLSRSDYFGSVSFLLCCLCICLGILVNTSLTHSKMTLFALASSFVTNMLFTHRHTCSHVRRQAFCSRMLSRIGESGLQIVSPFYVELNFFFFSIWWCNILFSLSIRNYFYSKTIKFCNKCLILLHIQFRFWCKVLRLQEKAFDLLH